MKPIEHIPDPVPAATLVLVREYRGQLQVYLIRRSPQSGFMPEMYAFPGGIVDRGDHDERLWQDHSNLNRRQIAQSLAGEMPVSIAAAFAGAALRECLEEVGVFLAETNERDARELDWVTEQARSPDRDTGWFNELVVRENWVLDFEALLPWSHWITPPEMQRRYDTRFFLAAMPDTQSCRPDNREAADGVWISPARALQENLSGSLPLSPPTLVTLDQFISYDKVKELLSAARSRGWSSSLTPRLVPFEAGALILEPWDPAYAHSEITIDHRGLASAVLNVGESFSRLWYSKGIWRPVAVC